MKNENILDKLSKIAFGSAIFGVCTIGICPAFGVIGIVAPLVMKIKRVPLSEETESRNKKAIIAGAISIAMFIADLILASIFYSKMYI